MQYSAVCDTDKFAYLAYLLSNIKCNGYCTERRVSEHGRNGGDEGGSCRGCYGVSLVDVFSRICMAEAPRVGGLDVASPDYAVGRYVNNFLSNDGRGVKDNVVGLAGIHDGGGDSCVDGSVCVGQHRDASETECARAAVGMDRVEPVVPLGLSQETDNSIVDKDIGSVSPRTLENRRKRARRKARKMAKKEAKRDGVEPCNDSKLRQSLEEKWQAENELAALRAKRQVAVLNSIDVNVESRRRNVAMQKFIERDMVAIEKTHATLRSNGDLSSDEETRVQTIISGGTISPNSSVSEAEVRQLQKSYADVSAKLEKLEAATRAVGLEPDYVDEWAKSQWTVEETTGRFSSETEKKLDAIYPEGYVIPEDPYRDEKTGKLRVSLVRF